MTITSVFSIIPGVESKMNGSTVILTKRVTKMYSEECQIQMSSKNGKISEKTSSHDVKSKRRV